MSYAVFVEDAGDKCWGVFTGDAPFVGDAGRTDLPDPEKAALVPDRRAFGRTYASPNEVERLG